MKLQKIFLFLPIILSSVATSAENVEIDAGKASVFRFSTTVHRTVEKDLMHATVYSRKTGKTLPELKKTVSTNLNQVIEKAKQFPEIEVEAEGIRNYVNYNNKGQIDGWTTEGQVYLQSKDFDAVAKILEELDGELAIGSVSFSVSPEKNAALEDEMTLEIIKQFQHKAEVIKKGLNARNYILADVQLNTPGGQQSHEIRPMMQMEKTVFASSESRADIPLEAGKATISATASGAVKFE